MKKWIWVMIVPVVLACVLIPRVSYTEDNDTVLLARVIYAMGRSETYETKLAIGSVVMNRVEDAWFANDLGQVLRQQQQFPAGERYDDESLKAARAVIGGAREVGRSALYLHAADASESWDDTYLVDSVGGYNFYSAARC